MTFCLVAVLFISIGRMPLLVLTVKNTDPLFTLVKTPGFYLHHVEMANQSPAGDSLYADKASLKASLYAVK